MDNSKVEPYVGMPVYLDDSFFDFVSAGAGVPADEDFVSASKHMECPNPNWGSGCNNRPGNPGSNNCENNNSGNSNSGNQGSMGGSSNCAEGCDKNGNLTDCIVGCPLAMAYVPMQKWGETYDMEKGFKAGTIFPCLDLPFKGGKR